MIKTGYLNHDANSFSLYVLDLEKVHGGNIVEVAKTANPSISIDIASTEEGYTNHTLDRRFNPYLLTIFNFYLPTFSLFKFYNDKP